MLFTAFCLELYRRHSPAKFLFKAYTPRYKALEKFPAKKIVYLPTGPNGFASLAAAPAGPVAATAAPVVQSFARAAAAAASTSVPNNDRPTAPSAAASGTRQVGVVLVWSGEAAASSQN